MNAETMLDLYISELRDMYNAEKQLVKVLPKLVAGAASTELAEAFENHLEQTLEHVNRLEGIFEDLGKRPVGEKCEGMEGLIKEGSEALDAGGDEDVRDAGIIIAAQKVEHYEIAGYGSLCALAKRLGRKRDIDSLKQTLEEEKEADQKLSSIAESKVNVKAAMK